MGARHNDDSGTDEDDEDDEDGEPEPVVVEITDTLDLHTFAPRDVKELVADYVELAVEKGLTEVRIIHGKGDGTLRRIVHAVLDKHPRVASYRLATDASGWGATVASLSRRP
jgi:dsDNA-specific endonuclease/ATPase MutS2